jgi:hypothetical protein
MKPKQNCWEFKKCGRIPGGEKAAELGECPASTKTTANGVNGGKKGGRICWAIAGTFCGGKVQGTYAYEIPTCMNCEFLKKVRFEEFHINELVSAKVWGR